MCLYLEDLAELYTFSGRIGHDTHESFRSFLEGIPELDYVYQLADINGSSYWLSQNSLSQFLANTLLNNIIVSTLAEIHPTSKLLLLGSTWAMPISHDLLFEHDFGGSGYEENLASYAKAKIYLLDLARYAKKDAGLKFTYFITSTVFGANDSSDHLIPSVHRQICDPTVTSIILKTDGSEERSFLYVEDLVEALWLMRDCEQEVLCVPGPFRHSILEIVGLIAMSQGSDKEVVYGSFPGVTTAQLSVDLSERLYGWPSGYELVSPEHFLFNCDLS